MELKQLTSLKQIKNKDDLKEFKNWFLKNNTIQVPYDNPLMFIDGIAGITLYRKKPYQVQLFILEPNTIIKEHSHPNIDSYEMFLWGMKFTHKSKIIIDEKMALLKKNDMPRCSHWTLRIKTNELHGGKASDKGGSFISIQKWLNNIDPTHVSKDWNGDILGEKHKKQLNE
jgi:hypothetical protein